MSFFGEIASVLGYDEAKLSLGYNYVVYNGEAVYIEGIKKILRIDARVAAFMLRKGVLYVEGKDLVMADISGGSVLIRGEIQAVYTGEALKRKEGES